MQEINARHEVVLHVGTSVIGAHNPDVTKAPAPILVPPTQYVLEIQAAANPIDPAFRNQVFALDGDSILLASNRNLVAQALNNRGANKEPPVGVAARTLADAEFWDFEAVDGSGRDPTSGFIRVSTRDALFNAIMHVNQTARDSNGAAWGSVIKIVDPGVPIELSFTASGCAPQPFYVCSYDAAHGRFNVHNMLIPTGVTVRGDRRGTLPGPLLHADYECAPVNGHDPCEYDDMFHILGDDVRITGLRVQGPSHCVLDPDGCHSTNLPMVIGIQVGSLVSVEPAGVIVDHNDAFDWPEAAVNIASGLDASDACPGQSSPPPNYALVTRNFLHHNENNDGYGVGIYKGGAALITGNTFLMNRHSISGGDGEPHDQYDAAFNLVLSDVPGVHGNREQDFDMHGTEQPGHWMGGFAGSKVTIHSNAFLGGGRDNFQTARAALRRRGRSDDHASGIRFDFNMTMNGSPVLDRRQGRQHPEPSAAERARPVVDAVRGFPGECAARDQSCRSTRSRRLRSRRQGGRVPGDRGRVVPTLRRVQRNGASSMPRPIASITCSLAISMGTVAPTSSRSMGATGWCPGVARRSGRGSTRATRR